MVNKDTFPASIGKQEPMKIETLKIDSERLEIVREILAQNKMIL